jgi:23S rRNA pseudouridine2605 synthase
LRINKYIASSGVCSRRKAEELVLDGLIKVNGRTINSLATEIKDNDIVTFNNSKIEPKLSHVYLMLHKPKGYICSNADDKGRKTVMELVSSKYSKQRLFAVGRLDYDTEGLLLLSTDGDMANRLMHPSFEVPKTYIAKIEGEITQDEIKNLSKGVILDGTVTKKCKIKLLSTEQNLSRLEVVITEGRNRQVRRMFETINKQVVFLKRTAIGEINLGGLTRGTHRELNQTEIKFLSRL